MKLKSDKGISIIKLIIVFLIILIGIGIIYEATHDETTYPKRPGYGTGNVGGGEEEVLTYPKLNKVKKDIAQFVKNEKTCDWIYDPATSVGDSYSSYKESVVDYAGASSFAGKSFAPSSIQSFSDSVSSSSVNYESAVADTDYLGFSVGGAKNSTSYRENIENNYFPLETDITYEGIYYDYYFDTGGRIFPISWIKFKYQRIRL